jgi:hypothetical protein
MAVQEFPSNLRIPLLDNVRASSSDTYRIDDIAAIALEVEIVRYIGSN